MCTCTLLYHRINSCLCAQWLALPSHAPPPPCTPAFAPLLPSPPFPLLSHHAPPSHSLPHPAPASPPRLQVGFYQVCKVLITPTLLAVEFAWLQKRPGRAALLSTAVLLAGISVATLLDKQVGARARARCALHAWRAGRPCC